MRTRTNFTASRLGRFVMSGSLALFLSACGGGGGGDSGSVQVTTPPSPPPPTALAIHGGNYLEAAAVGAVAVDRASELTRSLDRAFNLMQVADGRNVSVSCLGGGGVGFVFDTSITASPAQCNEGGVVLASGTIVTSKLEVFLRDGLTLLRSGNFVVNDVVWRLADAGKDATLNTLNASVAANRRADDNVDLSGSFRVQRNGREDSYSNLSALAANFGRQLSVASVALSATSPRFAASPLAVDSTLVNGLRVLTIRAPDGSYVKVSTINTGTPAQFRFDVYSSAAATNPVTQIYAENDPLYTAALAKALQ